MAAGIRQRSRRHWPRGLRVSDTGYFSFEVPADVLRDNPGMDQSKGLGRIKLDEAIAQVTEFYVRAFGVQKEKRLAGELFKDPETFADWIPTYLEKLSARGVETETAQIARRRLDRAMDALGKIGIAKVTTRHIADYIGTLASTPRTQQAVRSLLLDVFREALASGWCSANPVAPTRSERVATQRGRLSLEAFRAIHAWSAANQPAWATRAMELAIVTAQRRGDVAAMTFAAVRDGYLRVEQQKSGGSTKVAIPLSLRLDALGWTVGDVIGRCRDAVLSRNLVHHSTAAGRAKAGDKIRDMTIGQAFAEARDAAGVTVSGKTPPTFHEIRSLSVRLYHDQGINAQALAGHKSADMTSVYRDVRGDEWITVGVKK